MSWVSQCHSKNRGSTASLPPLVSSVSECLAHDTAAKRVTGLAAEKQLRLRSLEDLDIISLSLPR